MTSEITTGHRSVGDSALMFWGSRSLAMIDEQVHREVLNAEVSQEASDDLSGLTGASNSRHLLPHSLR